MEGTFKKFVAIAVIGLMSGFLILILFSGRWQTSTRSGAPHSVTLDAYANIGKLTYRDALPTAHGHSVLVNLDAKEITLYRDAVPLSVIKLRDGGKAEATGETLPGRYTVLKKEKTHTSPLTKETYPYAIQFFGNSFFHGMPIKNETDKKNGTLRLRPLALSDVDAARLYRFLAVGDVVIVKSKKTNTFISPLRLAAMGALPPAAMPLNIPIHRVSALSYYVADLDSGAIIAHHDEDTKRPIASISKLITTITATEMYPPASIVTVSPHAQNTFGTAGELTYGERMTVGQILYPLLLESSNDAATAIAESLGYEQFVMNMNKKVVSLGLTHTSFADPSGLSANNMSTARDLFTLAQYLYKKRSDILEITTTKSYALGGSDTRTVLHYWTNRNKFVRARDARYVGGKTGFITESGLTSVALFSLPLSEFSAKHIAIILLNSVNRDRDTALVLQTLYDTVAYEGGITLRDLGQVPPASFSLDEATTSRSSLMFVGRVATQKNLDAPNALFSQSSFLKQASLSVVPLTTALTTRGYPVLLEDTKLPESGSPDFAPVLRTAGFMLAALADRGVSNFGRIGIADTLTELRKAGIDTMGAGDDTRAAEALYTKTIDGRTYGFINVSEKIPEWLRAADNVPTLAAPQFSELLISVAESKRLVAVLTVLINRDESAVSDEQFISQAQRLIDQGATMVIGIGPHRVESPITYHAGLIAPSLGDFLVPSDRLTAPPQGMVLEVIIEADTIVQSNASLLQFDTQGIPRLSEDDR